MKDIAFVAAPICDSVGGALIPAMQDSYHECPQLGVATLASILRHGGYDCDLVDWVTADDSSINHVADSLSRFRLVFISANSMNWAAVLQLLRRVKHVSPSTVTCIGGPHPTLHPENLAGRKEIDLYVVGEADNIVCHIAECVLERNISGLQRAPFNLHIGINFDSLKSKPISGLIPKQENLRQLEEIPVEYALYDISKYCVVPVETSRGCKFRCEFCSIPTKSYWRDYSVERSVQLLNHALPYALQSKARVVSIIDDTFTTSAERVVEIAKRLGAEFHGRLNFDATVVDIRKEIVVEAMAEFASGLLIGAEVASKPDAKRIKKAATPKLVQESAAVLQKYGVSSKAVFS
ncbi:MAG: cobalamin-dependent protein, partial [Planktotalea sp.]|uniref:B12-binding domain-containing radical SAM protein n=1 Tax=Planktotalea sp. TaxID=2029877 RepID=UPI003C75285C